jgi:hypothetical protein
MEDLPSLVDDWATYRATLVARLAPFQTMIEDVSIATKCATQQGAIDWLTRSRQSSLDAVTAYLSSQTVVNACRICDRGGGCQASVCDADSLISGEPLLWLGNEIKIWWQAMIISSVCPVDALGPLVEKLVALAKYQAAIRELNCDWRCVIEHGTHDFFGELLYGNVCTFSIFALELYQEHNPCE